MNRRRYLQLASVAAAATVPAFSVVAPACPLPLYVDMNVDPSKEKDLLNLYKTQFKPAMSKQPGFVGLQLLKLHSVAGGKGPGDFNYRLIIEFQHEEQRLKWVETPIHKKLWPMMESHFRGDKYNAVLYDAID